MTGFIRSSYVHVGATASAAIVALGLVTVPPERYDSVVARTEFAAVQLQAAVSTQISAVVNSTPFAAAVAAIDTATPRASASSGAETLTQIVTAALAIAAVPLWYLAFPVTLPLSLVGGVALVSFGNALPLGFGLGGTLDPLRVGLFGLIAGIGVFAVGPLGLAFGSVSALFTPSATPAAARRPLAAAQVAEPSAAAPTESTAVVKVPNAITTKAAAPNSGRSRAASQRAREIVQPAATASPVIAASTPEAINTPASAAPPAARKSRTARAEKNTANADSVKRTGQATAAAQ